MENEDRGEIPDMGKLQKNCNMSTADDDATVKEMNKEKEEDAALRKMQDKVEKEMGCIQDPREEVDCRSIFVGNVDYACKPQELQQHFQSCGMVNRVTILTDKFGQPKGFAFVEFVEFQSADEALRLNKSEIHGRQLKVSPKRTNVPGMKQNPPNPYGYGKIPRFTRPTRYRPYN